MKRGMESKLIVESIDVLKRTPRHEEDVEKKTEESIFTIGSSLARDSFFIACVKKFWRSTMRVV